MKKTLMIAVLACVLVLAGCGKGKGTQSPKSDESVAAEAVQNKGIDKRETDESETESIPTKERVSRNAVSGANLTREDGSVSFVYIMADDSVVSENGENFVSKFQGGGLSCGENGFPSRRHVSVDGIVHGRHAGVCGRKYPHERLRPRSGCADRTD